MTPIQSNYLNLKYIFVHLHFNVNIVHTWQSMSDTKSNIWTNGKHNSNILNKLYSFQRETVLLDYLLSNLTGPG